MVSVKLLLLSVDAPLINTLNLHTSGAMDNAFAIQKQSYMRDAHITCAVVGFSTFAVGVSVVEEHQITGLCIF